MVPTNDQQKITEGPAARLFIVRGGVAITTAITSGILKASAIARHFGCLPRCPSGDRAEATRFVRLEWLDRVSAAPGTARRHRSHDRRSELVCVAAVSLLLASGHRERLPTAPSDFRGGVVIYEHANFLGASAHISNDIRDLKDVDGPCVRYETSGGVTPSTTAKFSWDDCISSIRIAAGWGAVVYRDDDFKGQSLRLTADVPNLQLESGTCDHDGLNDCITSIRIVPP